MTGDESDPSTGASRDVDPILVRIGDRELFLGDQRAADPEYHDRTFETVISLTIRERPLTTHHHPLRDGPGNDVEDFVAAVEDARGAIAAEGRTTLVHCAAGISRSSTVITTALAAEEDREFDDVLWELKTHRQRASPHPALRALAREYLGEEPTPAEVDARDRDSRDGGDSRAGLGSEGRSDHESLIDYLESKTTDERDFVDAADGESNSDGADGHDGEATNMKTETNDCDSER